MREGKTETTSASPLLVRGALYSLDQIREILGVSKTTVARWQAAGLKIRMPATKRAFVLSDDVFELMANWNNDEGEQA